MRAHNSEYVIMTVKDSELMQSLQCTVRMISVRIFVKDVILVSLYTFLFRFCYHSKSAKVYFIFLFSVCSALF